MQGNDKTYLSAILETKVRIVGTVGSTLLSCHITGAQEVIREHTGSLVNKATEVRCAQGGGGSGNVESVGVEVDTVTGATLLCWVASALHRALGITDGLGSVGVSAVALAAKFESKVLVPKAEGRTALDGHGITGVGRGGQKTLAIDVADEASIAG